jgi:hypothetical protein
MSGQVLVAAAGSPVKASPSAYNAPSDGSGEIALNFMIITAFTATLGDVIRQE